MAEFEDKLNSILSNPALMGQIMSMAGSLGQEPSPPPPPQPATPTSGMNFDPATMANMMQLLRSTQIGQREQRLLQALDGYLPKDRLEKLMKAMQAAKIAKYASGALAKGR